MAKDYNVLPGGYSAGMYIAGQVVEAALKKTGGKSDDKKAFNEALRGVADLGAQRINAATGGMSIPGLM